MMSNTTSESDRSAAQTSDYHVPAELVAIDKWDTIQSGDTAMEKGFKERTCIPVVLDSFENRLDSRDSKFSELAFAIHEDSEYSLVVIRTAIDTSGDEATVNPDVDLSELNDRDIWYGVSPDGERVMIPVRRGGRALDTYDGYIEVVEEATMAFAKEDNDALDLVDVDKTDPIARYESWLQDWLNDTYESLTDDGSPEWVKRYRAWKGRREKQDASPSQTEECDYLAREIEDHYEFMTLPTDEDGVGSRPLYVYDDKTGTFDRSGAAFIETLLTKYVGSSLPTYRWSEIINRIRAMLSPTDPDMLNAADYDADLLCVANGVLNVENGKLRDHDPEYKFTIRLPVEYDPDADANAFERFLDDITGCEADKKTLEEWIGYTLSSKYDLHRFLILLGDGGNGKSVLLDALRNFLSEDNVSEVGLERMRASDTYGLADIEGKMLNIDGDTSGDDFYGSELNKLKQMTGGDRVTIERKHQQPYSIKNTAKLMFSANKPPRLVDESGNAIPRRLLWVRFPNEFVNDPELPHEKQKVPRDELMDDLLSEESKKGILNLAINGLRRLREQGCFTKELDTDDDERYEQYLKLADDIAAFESLMLEEAHGHGIPKEVVYSAYVAWMNSKQTGKTLNKSSFFRALNKRGGGYWNSGQYSVNGNRPRALFGVRFADRAYEFLTDTDKEAVQTLYCASQKLDERDAPALMYVSDEETKDIEVDEDADVDTLEVSQMQRLARVFDALDYHGEASVSTLAAEARLPPEQVKADLNGLAECGEVTRRETEEGQEVFGR